MNFWVMISKEFQAWRNDIRALAAVEFGMIFPIMFMLLLGVFEFGTGLSINKRAITASQIAGDLIARNTIVDQTIVNEAIRAAELAMAPYDTTDFGIDVISVSFDENDAPTLEWQETSNMTPDAGTIARTQGLGAEGEGAIVVHVEYRYTPIFSGALLDTFVMDEVSFSRGRRVPVVTWPGWEPAADGGGGAGGGGET